jgi:hypothetical protein
MRFGASAEKVGSRLIEWLQVPSPQVPHKLSKVVAVCGGGAV